MNETLIENWNRHVKPKDVVYHLGDFAYKNKDAALSIRNRLNGQIFFVEGNHDATTWQIRHTFGWYKQLAEIKIGEQKIVLCHYAMRTWDKSHYGSYALYGHSHHSLPDDPNSLSFDVGVDSVAMMFHPTMNHEWGKGENYEGANPKDYRPLNFEEVKQVMSRKTFKPIDHHGKDR